MELNKELLAKAKNAKTPEELMALANENGMELTEESAKAYFEPASSARRANSATTSLTTLPAAAAITAAGLSFP